MTQGSDSLAAMAAIIKVQEAEMRGLQVELAGVVSAAGREAERAEQLRSQIGLLERINNQQHQEIERLRAALIVAERENADWRTRDKETWAAGCEAGRGYPNAVVIPDEPHLRPELQEIFDEEMAQPGTQEALEYLADA